MLSSENDDATNKAGSTIWMGSQIIVLKVTTKEGKNYKGEEKNYRELRLVITLLCRRECEKAISNQWLVQTADIERLNFYSADIHNQFWILGDKV